MTLRARFADLPEVADGVRANRRLDRRSAVEQLTSRSIVSPRTVVLDGKARNTGPVATAERPLTLLEAVSANGDSANNRAHHRRSGTGR